MNVNRIVNLPNLTLLTALSLSAIAAWYSIVGLTAIFAAAVIPIIIMGGALEIAKVVTTVWLHRYWDRASLTLKLYLVPALVVLAFLTSMGIFGFLSKAHMDQGVPTGDVAAKVALIDEKIKTERENIELARKALQQMDAQVDARLSRGESEAGAERAVQIRRQQQGERSKLQKDISDSQKRIAALNEERAPIASELRKVEAEVGPIKYIAALIYGDNPDNDLLEKAVRWVIIIIVAVFDPLALTLVIAATSSKNWLREEKPKYEKDDGPLSDDQIKQLNDIASTDKKPEPVVVAEKLDEPSDDKVWPFPDITNSEQIIPEQQVDQTHDYLKKPFSHFKNLKPMVYNPEIEKTEEVKTEIKKVETTPKSETTIITEGVTKENPLRELPDNADYVVLEGKHMRKEAALAMRPDLFKLKADSPNQSKSNFGTKFPNLANKGDIFVRVDILPNRVFKYDGNNWIEINKNNTDVYLHDRKYISFLIEKIEKGEYDPEMLSDHERSEVETYLKNQSS